MEGRVEQWSRSLGMSTWVKLHMVLYAGSKEIRCGGIIYVYIESLRYIGRWPSDHTTQEHERRSVTGIVHA
jgi:hypothetical protein